MGTYCTCGLISASVALTALTAAAQETPYVQKENVVYGEVHGVGLLMDVFTPKDQNLTAMIGEIADLLGRNGSSRG